MVGEANECGLRHNDVSLSPSLCISLSSWFMFALQIGFFLPSSNFVVSPQPSEFGRASDIAREHQHQHFEINVVKIICSNLFDPSSADFLQSVAVCFVVAACSSSGGSAWAIASHSNVSPVMGTFQNMILKSDGT